MTSTETLTSLAMLKVNKDVRDIDYLDYLKPFVLEVLRRHRPDPVHDQVVADHLKKDFGLWIPNRGIQLVLSRLRRPGIVVKRDNVFRLVGEIDDTGIDERRMDAQRRIDVLLNQIVDYARVQYEEDWTVDKAAEVLKSYLSDFGIDCLKTYVHRTALPDTTKKTPREICLINTFVRDAYRSSLERFENLILVVKGNMLANALLCPDLQSLQKKFDQVTFYLDTPFLLRVLGLQSPTQNAAAQDLVALLSSLRGRLAVFDQTIDELNRVLKGAEANFKSIGTKSRLVAELVQQGKEASDLTLVRSQLDRLLDQLRIKRVPHPKHAAEFQIDESVLDGVLEEEIGYFNPQARFHDLDCIRCIFTLRRTVRPVRLEDALAVFVTPNSSLAKAAFKFGKNFEHSREISPVITDFSLANVAWLKAPLVAPNLPEREVLAACYAALQPPEPLWKKYLSEVDRLKESSQISEHDHAFLRYDGVAREELMDMTLGDIDALSEETIPQILERAKNAIVSEERAQQERLTLENQELRDCQGAIIQRAYWISELAGSTIAWSCVLIFALATFAVVGLLPRSWTDAPSKSQFWTFGMGGLVLVGTLLALVDQLFGHSVRDIFFWMRRKVRTGSFNALTKIFGIGRERQ